MKNEKQIKKGGMIGSGVSYESFLRGVEETFEKIVKPEVEEEKLLSDEEKNSILSKAKESGLSYNPAI